MCFFFFSKYICTYIFPLVIYRTRTVATIVLHLKSYYSLIIRVVSLFPVRHYMICSSYSFREEFLMVHSYTDTCGGSCGGGGGGDGGGGWLFSRVVANTGTGGRKRGREVSCVCRLANFRSFHDRITIIETMISRWSVLQYFVENGLHSPSPSSFMAWMKLTSVALTTAAFAISYSPRTRYHNDSTY